MSLHDLIYFIITNIVDHPEQVEIEEKDEEYGKKISIKVAQEDMGSVIGREGRRIKAIRRLTGIIGTKTQTKVFVELTG
ncbi:hypothetical protein A2Z23_03195 [Candidatus Curtissbacteria bacterium RBG_16_39_7]|uniref:RNA-binding protein KhpA n=1 Tax=Candidatus Curtissbacteria bacterium RBG_16_39_7 TaxID=1797707 RepID=A0A1F5G2T6_9BACT|nr:MAG: hypothetical protein A2Z23_03195 [Candidatus Curtissbacteria bacterium RBG_16_39_7]